ncbi:MAG: hypothetical protein CM15mP33_03020 [Candidatus Neomarinimicrobiota bacterium]|nr:MAG: hypothetical protein CM15mP33_03020 [Candidatus Neomarinimicrobiota bacterium]
MLGFFFGGIMIEINNERENIDNIDNMIFDLLVDRLDPVMKIGEIKSKIIYQLKIQSEKIPFMLELMQDFLKKKAKYLKKYIKV